MNRKQTAEQLLDMFTRRIDEKLHSIVDFWELYGGMQVFPFIPAAEIRAKIPEEITLLAHTAGLNVWAADEKEAELYQKNIQSVIDLKSPWCSEDLVHFVSGGSNYGVNFGILLNQESLDNSIRRINKLREDVPVPFLAENPPVEYFVGDMTLDQYFRGLSEETDTGLLLDLGHLYAYSLLAKENPLDVLRRFPLDRVCELHIAGGFVDPAGYYVDNHAYPIRQEVLNLLPYALQNTPHLKALTYEFYEMPLHAAHDTLSQIREIYDQHFVAVR
ncbi:MAG: DUF692 family multinuclear iron-containing protein [Tumebacillaceae bacterium]